LKSALRKLYQLLPFKRPFCLLLRSVWRPPERIYRHLSFRGDFSVTLDDAHAFRMRHYGFPLENGLFWAGIPGCWEAVSIGLWIRLCRQANVIVDVGANTGVYALIAACLRPDATVYAFEPVQRVFDKLDANRQMNGFDIHCVCAALSDRNGTATIYDPGDEHLYSASVNKNTYGESPKMSLVEVPIVRLDRFIDEHRLPRVDLLKIDVETHEPEVLRGLGRYLRDHRPTMLIEIMDAQVAAGVEEQVAGLGYVYFNIDERAGVRRVDRLSSSDYFNFLLCTEETAATLGL
jgi:FkbM family methyltransferase